MIGHTYTLGRFVKVQSLLYSGRSFVSWVLLRPMVYMAGINSVTNMVSVFYPKPQLDIV